jgi:hypothetical protein
VHRRGRWIDPPCCQKHQRGKRPNKHHANGKASGEESDRGSAEALPKRRFGVRVWAFSHISE